MRRKSKQTRYVPHKFEIGQLVVIARRSPFVAAGKIGIVCDMRCSQYGSFAWRYKLLVEETMVSADEESLSDVGA